MESPTKTIRELSLRRELTAFSFNRLQGLAVALVLVSFSFTSAEEPLMKELAPGVWEIGRVKLEKDTSTVTFPASVNMHAGPLEYLLVAEGGKLHESFLQTSAEPYHIHLAMLLLGVKGAAAEGERPPNQIDESYLKNAPKLKGAPLDIFVIWNSDGKEHRVAAEEFLFDSERKAAMPRCPWIYNGSIIVNGDFLAQVERSIVALVTDPTALINRSPAIQQSDVVWSVRSNSAPPVGTPVTVSLLVKPSNP